MKTENKEIRQKQEDFEQVAEAQVQLSTGCLHSLRS